MFVFSEASGRGFGSAFYDGSVIDSREGAWSFSQASEDNSSWKGFCNTVDGVELQTKK